MTNEDNVLTVDDLIVEYMIYKVKNGYEPSFTGDEFINFLSFFEKNMRVSDTLYDSNLLFERFFQRKKEYDWSTTKNWSTHEKEFNPHMDINYDNKIDDYIINANYKLSDFDKSIINTYFMDNGMSKFDNYKGKAYNIRNIIGEYLSKYPKRKIDYSITIDEKFNYR